MTNQRCHIFLFCALILLVLSLGCMCDDNGPNTPGFRDQKDRARIWTCVGPCLKKYPGAMEFILKHSNQYAGLQVLFIGDVPKLSIYDENEQVVAEYDISKMSPDQIGKLLIENGCRKVQK